MCILCVVQKWSWRVATLLPWFVIPLLGLWGLSQLLPLPYRFEVTGPRLACVLVLLATLVWYQYLMPCLSAWRVRRNAQFRERKRFEALELQKLRKTAAKRCRNCFSPYRDQNPAGGKYMCSYCGHQSKRPILDLPIPSGSGISNPGIVNELFGRGGKILSGKVLSDNSSISHDWLDNGGWVAPSNAAGIFGEKEQCLDQKSHPHTSFLPHIWMTSFLKGIKRTWRKVFRISSLIEDDDDVDQRGLFSKRSDDGTQCHESRVVKARRKAHEKRQARLEKEQLEEEERKQREEVARMVEERRRLKDEKTEAENRARGSCQREGEKKREAEKRRLERKRDKDKSSSKSNSDVEDTMEKRLGRDNGWKQATDKKLETAQKECHHRTDLGKGGSSETTGGGKRSSVSNYGHGNAGTRYFDRMRGSFFGKASWTPTYVRKDKGNGFVDHNQPSPARRDLCPPEHFQEKLPMHGDDLMTKELAALELQQKTAPKSWQQLFTGSPTVAASNADVVGRPNTKAQPDVNVPQIPPRSPPHPVMHDNPINFGLSLPFTSPLFSNGPMDVVPGLVAKDNSYFTRTGETCNPLPREPESFQDPRYVPDLSSFLAPVPESLNNFQRPDLGRGFKPEENEMPHSLISTSSPLETSSRSSMPSPISPLRVTDERHNHYFGHAPWCPKAQDVHPPRALGEEFNSVSEKGLWQMWNTSPVLQDGLVAYLGNHTDWISPLDWSRPHKDEENRVPRTTASLFANEGQLPSGTHLSQNSLLGNGQYNGVFGPSVVPGLNDDPWLQKSSSCEPFVNGEDRFPALKNTIYGNPVRASINDSFGKSRANYWSQNEWAMHNARCNEGVVGNPSPVMIPSNVEGGLYYTPDVQSLRSFQ